MRASCVLLSLWVVWTAKALGHAVRSASNALTLAVLTLSVLAACRKAAPAALACTLEPNKAALVALVRSAADSSGLDRATVTTELWGGDTDSTGTACVKGVAPVRQSVSVWRLGFTSESTIVAFDSGRTDTVRFFLHRLPPPCCRLAGSWRVHLRVENPEGNRRTRRDASAAGTVAFSRRIPDPWPPLYSLHDSIVRFEFGRHAIDLTPILGGPFGEDRSTTIMGGGGSLLYEVVGLIETGDSVRLTIIPRMSHGGLTQWGRVRGDTIAGTWEQNAYCCGARGSFLMYRQPWSFDDDGLVAVALSDAETARRQVAAADSAWQRRAGRLRVRTFDEARGRYVDANYWIIRLGDPPQEQLSTMVLSDSSGWSAYSREEPGTYRVELSDFPCVGGRHFADSAYVRRHLLRTIVIRSGEATDLEMRINSRAVLTTSSLENPSAHRCVE